MTQTDPGPVHQVGLREVFQKLGSSFMWKQSLNKEQKKAFLDIAQCRTVVRGGHLWECSKCCHKMPMYNSCLNRNCPQCQSYARQKWVDARMKDLLNVPYFHVVFTLPHDLNPLIASNPSKLLGLLFKAASATLNSFGWDPRFLGGQLGFLAVLHTWNQKLNRHYHLHCIVAGGALKDADWIPSKSKERSRYLFPVKALSQTFRRVFWNGSKTPKGSQPLKGPSRQSFPGLNALLDKASLRIPKGLETESSPGVLGNKLYAKPWMVYAKAPFAGPQRVLKYLGGYTHRVALSNRRILRMEDGQVTFSYKERRKGLADLPKQMTLPMEDFTKRFLQHVLPSGFMKIRYYGFLSPCNKREKLAHLKSLLGSPVIDSQPASQDEETELVGPAPKCPKCKSPSMVRVGDLTAVMFEVNVPWVWDSS